jgi:hypothetical protein
MAAMVEPPDDRLTNEELLAVAADARYGGFFSRLRFRRVFHPWRVLALVSRVEDHDRALNAISRDWREQCMRYEKQLERARALVPDWRARTPGIDNGWAAELEEALNADVKTPPTS